MAKRYYFLALCIFLPEFASAQSIISGTVTDDTGEPLVGANVLIESLVLTSTVTPPHMNICRAGFPGKVNTSCPPSGWDEISPVIINEIANNYVRFNSVFEAFRALYQSTNGVNWTMNSGWDITQEPTLDELADWHGVTVSNSKVILLQLKNNNLVGTIPEELDAISDLKGLDFRQNSLSGPIPSEIGNISQLVSLYLTENSLSGSIPAKLGQLSQLEQLWLDDNSLTGEIPKELGQLTSLKEIILNENSLSGSIPAQLGQLSQLEELWLYTNSLTGEIPKELGQLSSLKNILLFQNSLSGSIPAQLGQLSQLEGLWLHDNSLTGEIPKELGQLTSSKEIILNENSLSGSIPVQLGQLSQLEQLLLDDNSLTGEIPKELGQLSSLKYLLLNENSLSGSIPVQLGQLSQLKQLWLHNNSLTGEIPKELGQLSSLEHLILNENSLSGSIPVQLGQLSQLQHLLLYGNHISGFIPQELSQLSQLKTLDLENNELTGSIPSEIGKLSQLVALYLLGNSLTGTIPAELGELSNLKVLDVRNNSLTGRLPRNLMKLDHLQILSFSGQELCAPSDDEFQRWLQRIQSVDGPTCVGIQFALPSANVGEDVGTHNVRVNINPAPQSDLTLEYDLGGTAAEGSDYSINSSGRIAVTSGRSSASIPIMITDDGEDEEAETVILTLKSGAGYDLGNPNPHTLTIIDNDETSVVNFALASSDVNEDAGTHNVTINIIPMPPVALTLNYSLGGTAAENTDYSIENSGSISVAAGETAASIPVVIIDDSVVEANETIEFTLITGTGYTTGSTKEHMVTIEDNDQPVPATVMLTANPKRVEEGASVDVTVTISVEQPGNVVIPLTYIPLDPYPATSDDYHSLPSIVIPAGALTGSDDLRTIDDDSYEEDEAFTVAIDEDLLPAGINLDSPVSERVTITNNDSAPLVQARFSVAPRIVEEGNSVTVAVELPVELSSSVTIPLLLTPISAEPKDYRAPTPRQVEIRAEQTRGEYKIAIHDDKEAREGDETFIVEVNEEGVPDEVGFANLSPITVTIIDNDRAGIQALTAVSILEGQTETFQFSLTSEPQAEVTVTITGHAGTDLILTPAVRIFLPSNWSEVQEVTLRAVEDLDFDHELVPLTFTASRGGYTGISEIVEVIIIDKDRPEMNAPASVVVSEGLSEKFDIELVKAPSGTVMVIVPSPVGDLTAAPTSLIFAPDTWQMPQSITLTAREDDDFLPDFETLTLRANGGGYENMTYDIAVTISENDAPGIVAPKEVTMEEGSTSPFMIHLVAQPSEPVTINFTGHAGSDLTLNGVPLTFAASNWQTPRTVTLIASEDDMDYMDDRVDLMLTASGGGYDDVIHTAIVTIKDNDEASLTISISNQQGIESEESLQFRIELNRFTEEPVTVEYTSSDAGEAKAGLDYTASRGIVTFDPGATRGVIEIKITDDELVEENETFNVTLLNANENAEIDRAVGIGTILDNDGSAKLRVDDALVMEEEGVVRFRVSLSHPRHQTVAASYRTQDGTAKSGEDYEAVSGVIDIAPGMTEATIAVPLLKDGMDWQEETFSVHLLSANHAEIEKAVGVATIQEFAMVSEKIMEAYAARFVRTASGQVVGALGGRFRLAADGVACAAVDRAEMAQFWYSASLWDPSLGELLADCRISQSMPLSSGSFSVWGQGAFRQFNGQGEDALTLQGEVTTGVFGADYRWRGGWFVGVLLSHSQGDGSFEVAGQSGDITSGLTGVYPYVSYAGTGWNVWGSAGGGHGQVEVLELKGDMASRFGALEMRGKLASGSAITLNYHGDILITDVEIADHDITAEVYRVRAGMEVNTRITGAMRPYLEVNVRQDGGSAETGTGLELGGGLRFFYPAWGLRGDMHTQGLVMHTADGFAEWGISGLLQLGSGSEGMMMRVRPSWGLGQGMSLHRQQTVRNVMPLHAATNRTELELGYGIPWMDGVVRSVAGGTWLPQGMMYRIGGELRPRDRWTFSVFALTHRHSNERRDIGVNMQGTLQY